MKIRDPRLVKAAGWLGTQFARRLIGTLRFQFHNIGPVMAPVSEIPAGPRYLYCLWHENLLLPAVTLGHPDLAVLISKHADGQILGSLITAQGMGMVQGSTNRGGIEAVKAIVAGWPAWTETGSARRSRVHRLPDGDAARTRGHRLSASFSHEKLGPVRRPSAGWSGGFD
jgi:Domain of unknown function (DUF374)